MSITLQRQPTANTCVSACIAMLTGLNVDAVVDEFHPLFANYDIDPKQYLGDKGVEVKRTEDRQKLEIDKVYMLLVPSINSMGAFHMVLCDTRDSDMVISDPARVGSQRYVGHDAEPGETELLSWSIEYEVVHAPSIGIFKDGH